MIEIKTDQKKNSQEIKNVLTTANFNPIDNKDTVNFFNKKYKIIIENEYNKKSVLNTSTNVKILNFENDTIYINYDDLKKIDKIDKIKNIKKTIELEILTKTLINLKKPDKDELKTIIKKIKKNECILNIYTNIKI